jgi:uracil-DNA glycosylase
VSRLAAPLDAAFDAVAPGWHGLVEDWRRSDAGVRLRWRLQQRLDAGAVVYPARPLRALELTPLDQVRVVILGQDPYHGPGQAEGLAFSVPDGMPVPPSLRNIFRELARDLGHAPPASGNLASWARRGVLLLNTTLTVEDQSPASHAGLGWEALTDAVISKLSVSHQPVVLMLWGAHAQAKAPLVELAPGATKLVLRCNHPSPLSATRGPQPFMGCGHFGQAARFLAGHGVQMDWRLAASGGRGPASAVWAT